MNQNTLGIILIGVGGLLAVIGATKKAAARVCVGSAIVAWGLCLVMPQIIPQWLWIPSLFSVVAVFFAYQGLQWVAYLCLGGGWVAGILNLMGTSLNQVTNMITGLFL